MSNSWKTAVNEAREEFGEDFNKLHIDSRIAISKGARLVNADPVVTPIYHTSTYRFKTVAQWSEPNHGSNYIYSRCGNPTVENVEVIISEIECAAGTLMYNSGLAAVSAALLQFLSAGSHMVCMSPIYSGTYSFMTETLKRFGVEITFVNVETETDFPHAVEKAVKENTKLIYIEAIANPSMAVPDIPAVVEVAKKHKTRLVVDATFASPYLLKSIELGADFALHSCSKYIGGHADLIGGCISTATKEDWLALKTQQTTTGSAMSPHVASLVGRGLKTLALRMDKISENAHKIAHFLDQHPKVVQCLYPGLPSHPHHKAAAKVLEKFSGMIAFDVGSAEKAATVAENLRLIILAVSLGGTESLIEHPYSMSHGKQLLRDDDAPHIAPGLLRFSVGIEHVDDLIADLERALSLI